MGTTNVDDMNVETITITYCILRKNNSKRILKVWQVDLFFMVETKIVWELRIR